MVRPSRAAAVKDGRSSAATALAAQCVLDGREHDGKLACAGIDRALVDLNFAHLDPRLGLRLESAPVESSHFELRARSLSPV